MGKQETIKSLIPNLPEKDAKLAIKFLENQELEALKLLIDSAIYKIKKIISINLLFLLLKNLKSSASSLGETIIIKGRNDPASI